MSRHRMAMHGISAALCYTADDVGRVAALCCISDGVGRVASCGVRCQWLGVAWLLVLPKACAHQCGSKFVLLFECAYQAKHQNC